MASLIQIKRSLNTAQPGSLANGEPAYTANGDVLFIGSNDSIVAIAGKRTPGTLSANQAIVTDSASLIDTIMVGSGTSNAVINTTGIHLSNTDGESNSITITTPNDTEKGGSYYLKADGSWSTVTGATADPAGANTQIQFNDSSVMGASAGLAFQKDSNTLFSGNTIVLSSTSTNTHVNGSIVTVRNATYSSNLEAGVLTIGSMVVNTSSIAIAGGAVGNAISLNPTANNIALGNSIGRWVITANTVSTLGVEANSTALNPTSNTTLLGNTTGRWVITANSVGTQGFSGNATALNPTSNTITLGNTIGRWVITANSLATSDQVTVGDYLNVTNQTNTGTLFATTSANVGANIQLTTTALTIGSDSGSAAGLKVSVANSTGNVQILSTGVSIANSTGSVTIIRPTAAESGGEYYLKADGTWAIVSSVAGSDTQIQFNDGGSAFGGSDGFTFNKSTNNVTIANTLSVTDALVSGNLTVSGTVTTVDSQNLIVQDPLIRLADDQANTGTYQDTLDIGYYGTYGNNSQTLYTGLFRDASDSGIFKLFAGEIPVPTTTVDTANVNFDYAQLQAYFLTGDGSGYFESNTTGVWAVANSTWGVNLTANSMSLSTPLAATEGGTGVASWSSGDLLYGNTSNEAEILTKGSDGYILQCNATAVLWSTLDGGTF